MRTRSQKGPTTYFTACSQRDGQRTYTRVSLVKQPELLALKLRPGRTRPSRDTSSFLEHRTQPVLFLPRYGIKVYALAERDARDEAPASLSEDPQVDFAAPVFQQAPDNPDPMLVTRRFIVQFEPDTSRERIDTLNAHHGARLVEQLGYLRNTFVLEAPRTSDGLSAVSLANLYLESGLAVFAEPDFIRQRRFRGVTRAPGPRDSTGAGRPRFLSQQWHLLHTKVPDAWRVTSGREAIKIAVMDDGIDVSHPEFREKVAGQYDFEHDIADSSPKARQDNHGTACTGVALASGEQLMGVAPRCSLLAIRTPRFGAASDEARMFIWAAEQGADVISCSWGPVDGLGSTDPLPSLLASAIHECVRPGGIGRGGKGIPIFWAAGNGHEPISRDGYASNPDVMAVAACTSQETHSWYSDFGREVWLCAPSNGDSSRGDLAIFTTDRQGPVGYNPGHLSGGDEDGNYTNGFGGTSSATPLVAGVAALMLSVNPGLTQLQVRELLKQTAERIGSGYDASGHSHEFGYGRVHALRAVEAARLASTGWTSTGPGQPPSIQAPVSLSRSGGPPTFQISTGDNPYYAIEVTTRPELFDTARHAPERNDSNFFATWRTVPFLSAPSHTLPEGAWKQLEASDRLYYRLWTTANERQWVNFTVSVHDTQAASAPFIQLTDFGRRVDTSRAARAVPVPPSILGPDRWEHSAEAPTFRIEPGSNRFYGVEVATDWTLFDRETHGHRRGEETFYASWTQGLHEADGPTTYTLEEKAWRNLRHAPVLYYRVLTCAEQRHGWPDYATSTPDTRASEAPSLLVTRGQGATDLSERDLGPSLSMNPYREEEARWRGR